MMQKNRWVIWVLVAALIAGVIVFLAGNNKSKFNWNRSLNPDKSQPYDLSLFYATLKESMGNKFNEIPVKSSIEKYRSELLNAPSSTYFYIGQRFYLTSGENEIFNTFVQNGGTVFISCSGFPNNLMQGIAEFQQLAVNTIYADSIQVRFSNPNLKPKAATFFNLIKGKIQVGSWNIFSRDNSETDDSAAWVPEMNEGLARISSIDGNPDFIVLGYGSGQIYLHCNPVLFSNLYLKTASGRSYLQNVLKHVPNNTLWFDRSAGLVKADADLGYSRDSVLQYIKKFPGLYAAWLILCLGILLFIIFGGRRTQRAIPVIEKSQNNTLEFVNTIGYFYYKEKNNKYMLEKSWNQFVFFIKQHFGLNFSSADEEMAEKLSMKSGVEPRTISEILKKRDLYRILTQITSEELRDMEISLEQFYTKIKNDDGKYRRN